MIISYLVKPIHANNKIDKYAEEQFQLCEKIGMPFNQQVFIGSVADTALTTTKSLSGALWYHKEMHERKVRDFLEGK